MKYFKPVNKNQFNIETMLEKIMSLSDSELEQFVMMARKYGLSEKQITDGINYINKLRRQ
jgi:nitrogen-specific signal transduction histidine kinase